MLRKTLQEISNRPNLRKILKGGSYFFSEKMTRICLGFVLQTWLARHLGPVNMGIYSYIIDFASVFFPIILFGFDDILIKELVKGEEPGKALGTVFFFRLAIGIPVWILLAISVWWVRREASDIMLLTMLYGSLLFIRSLDTFYSYLHAHMLAKQLVRGRQVAYLIANIFRAGGLLSGAGFIYFIFNTYIQYTLERVIALYQARNLFKTKLRFDKDYLNHLLPQALPIAFTGFFTYAETRLGTFFLNRYETLETVGEFGVGRALLELWDFLPTTICLISFPVIIKARASDPLDYPLKLQKLYCFLFYLGLSFAISVSIVSPWVTHFLYGDRYDKTALVLSYGSFLAIITYINFARIKWYIMEGQTLLWLKIRSLSFAINFISQFYFTDKYGIIGPYFASFFAHLLGNAIAAIIIPRVRQDLKNVFLGILTPIFYLRKR